MLNDEICKLRDKLNKKIEENASYDEIYKISVELDELIAKFYKVKTMWILFTIFSICDIIFKDGALF